MKKYYFIYTRKGKGRGLNLWAVIIDISVERAIAQGMRTLFFGDFKYEHIDTIEIKP